MVMKTIFYIPNVGQFGNKLFPTLLASLICIQNNSKMNVVNNPLIKFKDSFIKDYVTDEKIEQHNSRIKITKPIKTDGEHLVLPRGYYQNYELFLPYINLLKSQVVDLPVLTKNTKDIVLHLRLDGFNHAGHDSHILHPDFYLNILRRESFEKVYIVMATKSGRIWKKQQLHKEQYLSYFSEFNHEIISNDEYADFEFIRSFDKIICSNSTFAWWAAFFSEASVVYIPEFFEGKHAKLNKMTNSVSCTQSYVNIETMETVPITFS